MSARERAGNCVPTRTLASVSPQSTVIFPPITAL